MMYKRSINIEGLDIQYYQSKESGKPVIFLHGSSLSASIFVRQFVDPVLSDKYRLIAIDFPGFGESGHSQSPENDYTVEGYAKLLTRFCKKLELCDTVYVGHGTGGNILVNAIEELTRTKGIVLISSAPLKNPVDMNMYLEHPAIPLFYKPNLTDGEINLISSSLVEPETAYPDFLPEVIKGADPNSRKYLFDSAFNADYKDQTKVLSELNIPIALLHGEKDQLVNYAYLKNLTIKNLWDKEIIIISDSGHLLFYENPADFNTVLLGFLDHAFK